MIFGERRCAGVMVYRYNAWCCVCHGHRILVMVADGPIDVSVCQHCGLSHDVLLHDPNAPKEIVH